jgi:uncharacterized membrane protein YagU involved in acid resistance
MMIVCSNFAELTFYFYNYMFYNMFYFVYHFPFSSLFLLILRPISQIIQKHTVDSSNEMYGIFQTKLF